MATCQHCTATTFVCSCGARVAIVQVMDTGHIGECELCGKIVDEACYRGMPDKGPKPKGIVRRAIKRLSRR